MLTAYVFRNSHFTQDHTNGGLSRDATRIAICNMDGPSSLEDCKDLPLVWLVTTPVIGEDPYPRLVPALADGSGPRPERSMFGGNYCGCADSRFSDAAGVGIAPIHDRYEREQP